jgi:hypothetical protein
MHSDVWTCLTMSITGMKYFATFIACYTHMTWVYILRHKDEVRCKHLELIMGQNMLTRDLEDSYQRKADTSWKKESSYIRGNVFPHVHYECT